MLRKNEYAHAASPSLAKTKFAHMVVKNRASHSLAETGGVLLVRVLRQVKLYICIYIYVLLDPAKASPFYPCGVKIATVGMLGEFNSPATTELDESFTDIIEISDAGASDPRVLHALEKKKGVCVWVQKYPFAWEAPL